MSLAATSIEATAVIVVSPEATVIACIGPQSVGVMLPLSVPLSALAVPTVSTHATTSPRRASSVRRMRRLLRKLGRHRARNPRACSTPPFELKPASVVAELIDESIGACEERVLRALRRRVTAHAVHERVVEAVGQLVRVAPWSQPRIGPVRRREREQRRSRIVEVAAQLAELTALPEERADSLLVATPLVEHLVAPLALEVAPLLHEHRRHVELIGHDAEVRAQREADLVGRAEAFVDRVEPRVEGARALEHRLVEQVLLGRDVGVERPLLHSERLGDLADRRAVVTLLGEKPSRFPRQLVSPARHGGTLTTVRYGDARATVPRVRPGRWPGGDG